MTPKEENAPQAPLDPSPAMPVLEAAIENAEWLEGQSRSPQGKAKYRAQAAALRALVGWLPLPKDLDIALDSMDYHVAQRGYLCEDDDHCAAYSALEGLREVLGGEK